MAQAARRGDHGQRCDVAVPGEVVGVGVLGGREGGYGRGVGTRLQLSEDCFGALLALSSALSLQVCIGWNWGYCIVVVGVVDVLYPSILPSTPSITRQRSGHLVRYSR